MHRNGKRLKGRRLVELTLKDGKPGCGSGTKRRREDKAKTLQRRVERSSAARRRVAGAKPGYRTAKVLILRGLWHVFSVLNGVELAAAEVERLRFVMGKRPGAAAAKNGNLIAGLVHGAVPVDSLRNRKSGTLGLGGGDQFRCRARAETGKVRGIIPGRNDLQDA